ncbi:MAG: hypothetical protein LBC30_01590 [Puniceicoccales bacterium]|nr:hypothetical protein [Puniceicoccales bacterium]
MDLQAYDSFILHFPIASKKPSQGNKKASAAIELGEMKAKPPANRRESGQRNAQINREAVSAVKTAATGSILRWRRIF